MENKLITARSTIFLILAICTLAGGLWRVAYPLYQHWIYNPKFEHIKNVIDFYETPLLIALICGWVYEKLYRRVYIKTQLTAQQKFKEEITAALSTSIKDLKEELTKEELKPQQKNIDRLNGRVDRLFELTFDLAKNAQNK
jgi:hypothetical protein